MRRKRHLHRRERQRKNKVIMVSMVSLVMLMACGYAAFSTSINLTAKGTIKKKEQTASEYLKTKVVTSGDGLYADSTESGRYVYKGTSDGVNNHIQVLGDDGTYHDYRIISIESDGTLKIIGDSIGDYTWNDNYNNDWSSATLQTYLNGYYYNSLYISSIVSHTFNVGAIGSDTSSLESTISEEKTITWTGNVGLLNVSDYLKANTNTEQCSTIDLVLSNYESCQSTNYLFIGEYYWTIAPYCNNSLYVWYVSSDGYIYRDYYAYDYTIGARPVLYLSSDISLSGDGTSESPYVVS